MFYYSKKTKEQLDVADVDFGRKIVWFWDADDTPVSAQLINVKISRVELTPDQIGDPPVIEVIPGTRPRG